MKTLNKDNIRIYDPYLKKYYKVDKIHLKQVEDEYGYDVTDCITLNLQRKGWDNRYEEQEDPHTDNYYWETFPESFRNIRKIQQH